MPHMEFYAKYHPNNAAAGENIKKVHYTVLNDKKGKATEMVDIRKDVERSYQIHFFLEHFRIKIILKK